MMSVTDVRAVSHSAGSRIDLSWRNPEAAELDPSRRFVGVRIVRRTRAFPRSDDDGTVVYESPSGGPVVSRFSDLELEPLRTYYYTVFTLDSHPDGSDLASRHTSRSHAVAFATISYNMAERLYRKLPAVHQRFDRPVDAGSIAETAVRDRFLALSEQLRAEGQLQRFLRATTSPLDLMRSTAELLPQLRDVDAARSDYLPNLSRFIGWQLDHTIPVDEQRNEIHHAPRFYRTLGTLPSLRAMVERYTQWQASVTEYRQHLYLSNAPSALNIFASVVRGGNREGLAEAASVLGFAQEKATGQVHPTATPASLQSGKEPFALRPDMEFSVRVGRHATTTVRFRADDFQQMQQATADEVAAVLQRTLPGVNVTRVDNSAGERKVELVTHATGREALIEIERSTSTAVTLESAPRGRLSAVRGDDNDVFLFYQVFDPRAASNAVAARQTLRQSSATEPPGAVAASTATMEHVPRRVRYKVFRRGRWSPSFSALGPDEHRGGDPAAARLNDGRLLLAWIENPGSDQAVIRFRTTSALPRPPQPAKLLGNQSGPFAIQPGSQLVVYGNWFGPDGIEFYASDFASPDAAEAEEVRDAIAARMPHVVPSVVDGRLQLQSKREGDDQQLQIDLAASTAAEAIGFRSGNDRADGDWADELAWDEMQTVPVPAGRHADLFGLVASDGVLWLFWSTHKEGRWNLESARWDGTAWSHLETLSAEGYGNREPCAVQDDSDNLVLVWSRDHLDGRSTLQTRLFPSGAAAWDAERPLTESGGPSSVSGRAAHVVRESTGPLRVYFQSERSGGRDIWHAALDATTATVSDLVHATPGPPQDDAPCPLVVSDNEAWLLFRSDRNLSMSGIGSQPVPAVDNRVQSRRSSDSDRPRRRASFRFNDSGTLRRFSGSETLRLQDAARIGARGDWDDLQSYTPQNPDGKNKLADEDRNTLQNPDGENKLADEVRYTRGTLGFFLHQRIASRQPSRPMIERLRTLLQQFLPINVRAVIVFNPQDITDTVYSPDHDIGESHFDSWPHVDHYEGPREARSTATLPDWIVLLATTLGHVSADPSSPDSLRNRSHFPPPS